MCGKRSSPAEPGGAEGRRGSPQRLAHAIQRVCRVRRRVHETMVEMDEGYSSVISRNVDRYLRCCDGTIHQRQENLAGAVRRRELLSPVPPRAGRHDASSHS